jgi:hypothetical protein
MVELNLSRLMLQHTLPELRTTDFAVLNELNLTMSLVFMASDAMLNYSTRKVTNFHLVSGKRRC